MLGSPKNVREEKMFEIMNGKPYMCFHIQKAVPVYIITKTIPVNGTPVERGKKVITMAII